MRTFNKVKLHLLLATIGAALFILPLKAQSTLSFGTVQTSLSTSVAGAATGTAFALPSGAANVISWQITHDGSAQSTRLEGSLDNTNWYTIDTSTAAAGEVRTTPINSLQFVRAVQVTRTGGTTTTISISANRAFLATSTALTSFQNGFTSLAPITILNGGGPGQGSIHLGGDTTSNAGLFGSGSLVEVRNAAGTAYTNIRASGFFLASGVTGLGSISPNGDGVFTLNNSTATDFNRLNFGGSTSSFPSIKKIATNALQIRLADDSSTGVWYGNFGVNNPLILNTAPTISSGFGTSPSIVSPVNGSASFRINVGTGGVATSGVIGMPAAGTIWNCMFNDMTGGIVTRQTAATTTTVTVTAASAWAASSIIFAQCLAI